MLFVHTGARRLAAQMILANWVFAVMASLTHSHAHESDAAPKYSAETAHAPKPMPDRIVLTWEDNPATTQSVTWRTDASIVHARAQVAPANANGRALQPIDVTAVTTPFQSDLNLAHYHTASFKGLEPETLYAYRVGDGVNWSEYFHFKTASSQSKPFSFIYFGDAQNDVRMHWSRVFREAFRDAPRAAFTLHAGDLIDVHSSDEEWGDWHHGPDWVNGTIPVIATPGNHEYRRINQGSPALRIWKNRAQQDIKVQVTGSEEVLTDAGKVRTITVLGPGGELGMVRIDDGGKIIAVDQGLVNLVGYQEGALVGTRFNRPPLSDRQQDPGEPAISLHWKHQFAFPEQEVPNHKLTESVYFIDYQGTRLISLNSNEALEAQIPWLRKVLRNNPNRWTVVTFHHPVFSPAFDRDNPKLRQLWKPILDEFKVDLVLSGHDHTYARTGDVDVALAANAPSGYGQAYDPEIGTVYVVSVSGPKMYEITKGSFAKRIAENTQLYQIIDIDGDTLRYRAFMATGELYDEFRLSKRSGLANELVEVFPEHEN